MVKSENPAAALARMRAAKLSPERRREIAIKASKAAAEARKRIPKAKREQIARNAGLASAAARRRRVEGKGE
jgi:hypothetical protein